MAVVSGGQRPHVGHKGRVGITGSTRLEEDATWMLNMKWISSMGAREDVGGELVWRRRAAWPLGEQHQHQHVVKLVVGPMDPTVVFKRLLCVQKVAFGLYARPGAITPPLI
uniref:Uncharacterized protein n=1 Tax=Oryza sativa subsp. japonica TaxID=39947 RepID=Q5Z806_ORYSJ|nr:hypothetical protein [Oryza sativa Japonica Group]BAD54055.1 hypothetical protein [Oryza sativa Japonica Group]